MDDVVVAALIGISGVVFGGGFSQFAVYMSQKFKLREFELKRAVKLHERKIAAANQHMDDVYLPLVAVAERLEIEAQPHYDPGCEELSPGFLSAFEDFEALMQSIIDSGKVIYLLPELHDDCMHLVRFIELSKSADDIMVKAKANLNMNRLVTRVEETYRAETYMFVSIVWRFLSFLFRGISRLPFMFDVGMKIDECRFVAAPVKSPEFGSGLMISLDRIRRQCREVALYREATEAE